MAVKRTRLKSMSAKQAAKIGRKVFSTLPAPTTPLRPVNPEREAKRRTTRKKHHAKYRASETFKIVERRAAGQCEASIQWEHASGVGIFIAEMCDGLEWMAYSHLVRCTNVGGLSHHHRTYARSGGGELPDDMCVLCKRCHEWIETHKYPHRKNGR